MKTITSDPNQSLVFVAFLAATHRHKAGQYKRFESARRSQNPGRMGALGLRESATRCRALETSSTSARRQASVPRRQLLALRVQDADQVVAVRSVVHGGAVHIAEERLFGVQRFDFRVELVNRGSVRENSDQGVGAGGFGVD